MDVERKEMFGQFHFFFGVYGRFVVGLVIIGIISIVFLLVGMDSYLSIGFFDDYDAVTAGIVFTDRGRMKVRTANDKRW